MKGEGALSWLYLGADAPEALVTRSCNTTTPHARRAAPPSVPPQGPSSPRPHAPDRGSLLHLAQQGSLHLRRAGKHPGPELGKGRVGAHPGQQTF